MPPKPILILLFALLAAPAGAEEPREILEILPPSEVAKQALADPAVVAERPVRPRLAALASAPRLPLPDGAVYDMVQTGVEPRGEKSFAWRGRVLVPGRPDGSVTLTVMDGDVAGMIVLPDTVYQILPATDGAAGDHRLLEIDQSRLPPCGGTVVPELRSGRAAPEEPAKTASRLDLLAVYTPALRERMGARQVRLSIQNAVDLSNSAFVNSRIDARLNLVHVQEVPFSEAESPSASLSWLRNDRNVANLRRTWGADLVSMFVDDTLQACGVAYLMPRGGVSPVFAPYAYSVVRESCASRQFSLAHELGHNLGANHDPENGAAGDAAYPYAFGHLVDGSFRTVMSYSTSCAQGCPRIDFFSHPGLTRSGQGLGIEEQRDNHRALHNTRDVATAFQPQAACRPGPNHLCLIGGRFKAELVWENQFDGSSGLGAALPRTDLAGFFSFGDPSNVELMVKMLDFGDVVKLFYGQLTNLRFNLIVTDLRSGAVKTYANTRGECGGIDQQAFAGGTGAVPAKAGTCRPGPRALCLMNNRFQVTVDWSNPGDGSAGQAGAVPLSRLTGAFHFGDPRNLELMTKILDFGDRIDLFYGTLSDLEYTVTVTDTTTGNARTYRNPAGSFCGGLDDAAF